jgi:hypothetical protein
MSINAMKPEQIAMNAVNAIPFGVGDVFLVESERIVYNGNRN